MNYKHLKAKEGGRIRFIVTVKNWLHQGFFYLDRTEMFYRFILEISLTSFFYFSLNTCIQSAWSIFFAFIISHTLNWIFNDNFQTCIMFTFPNVLNPGEQKTILYLRKMQDRLHKSSAISGAMIYGSMSRGKWQNKSDLDVRLLREPGVINGFVAYMVLFRERVIALFQKQPLDVYLADNIHFLQKMRQDEFPIFIKCEDARLNELYGEIHKTDFNTIVSLKFNS